MLLSYAAFFVPGKLSPSAILLCLRYSGRSRAPSNLQERGILSGGWHNVVIDDGGWHNVMMIEFAGTRHFERWVAQCGD